jgi:hypothetical protein
METARELIYRGNPLNHIEELARALQYASTEPRAPLSDKECNELNVSIYGGVSAEAIAVINRILAKRNTAQPSPKEQQCDGSCDNDWCTAAPAPTPITSAAQDDWNDQHGHRTEILPLIGGEPVKKDKAAPVDSDLAKKAHSAFMSASDKPWDAVVRVIQKDRDTRWMESIATEAEEHGVLTGVVGEFIAGAHERIEAPPTLQERTLDKLRDHSPQAHERAKVIAGTLWQRTTGRLTTDAST